MTTRPKINTSKDREDSLLAMLRAFYAHMPPRRRLHLAILMVLMLVGALAELLTLGAVVPFVALMAEPERAYDYPRLQQLFQALGWNDPESILLPMTALFVGLAIVASMIRLALLWVKNRFVFGLGYDIGVRLYDRILHQPYQFHVSRNSSEIIAGVTKVQSAINGVLRPLLQAVISLILAIGLISALVIVDAGVALAGGAIFAVLYLSVTVFTRLRLRKNSKIMAEAHTSRVRNIQEGLGGIRDVLLDSSQSHYLKNFARVDQRLRTAQATNAFIGEAPRYVIEAIGILLIVSFAYFLVHQPGGLIGALPVLGALALGAQRLMPLLQQIYRGWSSVLGKWQMMLDVLDFLDLPMPKSVDSSIQIPFEKELELRDVNFSYGNEGPEVLREFSLRIGKGERIGLIGKTGSGKTTALDIIMGLLNPVTGQLLIDGKNIDETNLPAWQAQIAHVPQAIYLTDGSIAQNIAFGLPAREIDMERVRQAARQAQIADFIESNSAGYQARVGERGIQLSGGQRPRIGLARAVDTRAQVLVFDEATSALDNQTESAVMESMEALGQDLPVLMIAHRLETLTSCTRIIRLSEGRIIGSGTYEEVVGTGQACPEQELTN
ncbi:MAG: ABC transporter ATP-binding protein/permease [Wenzhouxiangella sp.]|nr:ABC transporter ATP-binding protein/permease [Wenzhouxiangella sp.]